MKHKTTGPCDCLHCETLHDEQITCTCLGYSGRSCRCHLPQEKLCHCEDYYRDGMSCRDRRIRLGCTCRPCETRRNEVARENARAQRQFDEECRRHEEAMRRYQLPNGGYPSDDFQAPYDHDEWGNKRYR